MAVDCRLKPVFAFQRRPRRKFGANSLPILLGRFFFSYRASSSTLSSAAGERKRRTSIFATFRNYPRVALRASGVRDRGQVEEKKNYFVEKH